MDYNEYKRVIQEKYIGLLQKKSAEMKVELDKNLRCVSDHLSEKERNEVDLDPQLNLESQVPPVQVLNVCVINFQSQSKQDQTLCMIKVALVQSLPLGKTWTYTHHNVMGDNNVGQNKNIKKGVKDDKKYSNDDLSEEVGMCEEFDDNEEGGLEDDVLVELVEVMKGVKCINVEVDDDENTGADGIAMDDDERCLFEAIAEVTEINTPSELCTRYRQLTNESEGPSECTPDLSQ